MNRRTPEEIEAFNKAVKSALGNSKAGKRMTELCEELGAPSVHVRQALQAIGAQCLGKTRAARWFSASCVEKYGASALDPQAAAAA